MLGSRGCLAARVTAGRGALVLVCGTGGLCGPLEGVGARAEERRGQGAGPGREERQGACVGPPSSCCFIRAMTRGDVLVVWAPGAGPGPSTPQDLLLLGRGEGGGLALGCRGRGGLGCGLGGPWGSFGESCSAPQGSKATTGPGEAGTCLAEGEAASGREQLCHPPPSGPLVPGSEAPAACPGSDVLTHAAGGPGDGLPLLPAPSPECGSGRWTWLWPLWDVRALEGATPVT